MTWMCTSFHSTSLFKSYRKVKDEIDTDESPCCFEFLTILIFSLFRLRWCWRKCPMRSLDLGSVSGSTHYLKIHQCRKRCSISFLPWSHKSLHASYNLQINSLLLFFQVKKSWLNVHLCQEGSPTCQVNSTSQNGVLKLPKHSTEERVILIFLFPVFEP